MTTSESAKNNEQPDGANNRPARTRPSVHLIFLILILGIAVLGYIAVIWSGGIRGYHPSTIVAARDLAFFVPVLGVFFWLTRKQRFRGEMLLLTVAIFLFIVGQLIQFRLFSDPEYGARGAARTKAREAKAQTVRLLNVETGYDDQKKTFMFGSPAGIPKKPGGEAVHGTEYSLKDILTSVP